MRESRYEKMRLSTPIFRGSCWQRTPMTGDQRCSCSINKEKEENKKRIMAKGKFLRTVPTLHDVYTNDILYQNIINGDNPSGVSKIGTKCERNSRRKLSTSLRNRSSPLGDENYVTKNRKVCRVETPKSAPEGRSQVGRYSYKEQCNMISFLVETNRISSCCSIHIWQLMTIERSRRPAESLLKQFKTVIAPNIAQYLHRLRIIELPGVLHEFRLALNQAGIHENAASASLPAASSPSPIIRKPLRENRKRRHASPTPENIPIKKSRKSTESDRENCANKIIEFKELRIKLEPLSLDNSDLNINPYHGIDPIKYADTNDDDDENPAIFGPSEKENYETIYFQSPKNEEIKINYSMDDQTDYDNSDSGNESSKSKIIKSEVSYFDDDDEYEDDDKSLDYGLGRAIWEEMYGKITAANHRQRKKRIEFNEDIRIIKQPTPKSESFSPKLLNALNRERESDDTYKNKWSIAEELAILHYFICRPIKIKFCLGLKAYSEINKQNWPVLRGRSVAAMKEHFKENMLGYLDEFGLPKRIYDEFIYWEWDRRTVKN